MRTVFLDLLLAPCRATLSVSGIQDLSQLADMADVFIESSGQSDCPVATLFSYDSSIELLRKNLDHLSKDFCNFVSASKKRGRSESCNSRRPFLAKTDSENSNPKEKSLCFLHKKYEEKAHRCIKPCSYESQKNK